MARSATAFTLNYGSREPRTGTQHCARELQNDPTEAGKEIFREFSYYALGVASLRLTSVRKAILAGTPLERARPFD